MIPVKNTRFLADSEGGRGFRGPSENRDPRSVNFSNNRYFRSCSCAALDIFMRFKIRRRRAEAESPKVSCARRDVEVCFCR